MDTDDLAIDDVGETVSNRCQLIKELGVGEQCGTV